MSPNYPFFFSAWSPDLSIDPWRSTTLEFLSLEVPVSAGAGPWLDWSRKKHVEKPNQNAHLILTKNVPAKRRVQPAKWGSDLTKKELIISVHCIRCIIASWVLKGGLSSKHGELNRNNCYVCTYIYICVCVFVYIYNIYTRKKPWWRVVWCVTKYFSCIFLSEMKL